MKKPLHSMRARGHGHRRIHQRPAPPHDAHVRTGFRLTIQADGNLTGHLGPVGREAFAGFDIVPDDAVTVLAGELDQAALYGALFRIPSLGLELAGPTTDG